MENIGIRLSGGTLSKFHFDEFISKSRMALITLLFIFPILLSTGLYEVSPNVLIFSGLLIYLVLIYRLYWTTKAKHINKSNSQKYFLHFKILAYFSAAIWGLLNSYIVLQSHIDTKFGYFAMLVSFGMVAGGVNNFFPDKNLCRYHMILNLLPPSIACFFTSPEMLHAGIGGLLFIAFFLKSANVQHNFFWKANNNQNFLNTLFDNLPCPMSVINRDMTYARVNKELAKSLGFDTNDYTGKPIGFHTGYKKSSELLSLIAQGFNTEEALEKEISIYINDEFKHYFFVVSQINNGDQVVCISLDLTELKQIQLELEQQKAAGIDSARLFSVGELANSMAHEINNPLAVILGKTHQAQKLIHSLEIKNNNLNLCFEVISNNIARISNIIKALKQIVGNKDEEVETHYIDNLVESALVLTEERIRQSGIELRVGKIPNIAINCNPSKISQLILNTLNNAYDATIKTPNPWIELTVDSDEWNVYISITDSGPGIPDHLLPKLFHPFFTTKELGKGIGLGLSVSKGIAESHRGRFYLDNECKNTCFVISLPKHTAAA